MATVTNNPAQFSATNGNITDLKITFTPMRSGSGTPSSSNIRTLIGYDKIIINRSGKNMFDDSTGIELTTKYMKFALTEG